MLVEGQGGGKAAIEEPAATLSADKKKELIKGELEKGRTPQQIAIEHHVSIRDVAKFQKEREAEKDLGKQNAEVVSVFRLLKKGTKLEDIVIETGLAPAKVEEVYKTYERLTSHDNPICNIAYDRSYSKLKSQMGTLDRLCPNC